MQPQWRVRLAAVCVFVLLIGLGLLLRDEGLAFAANIAQLVSVVPLAVALIGRLVRNKSSDADSDDSTIEDLARAVRSQWFQEAAVRGLTDPLIPLAVDWSPGSPAVTDRWNSAKPELRANSSKPAQLATHLRSQKHRRLAIIGPPGCGKTSLAVLLLLAILQQRRPKEPVPVLLSISSWRPDREHLHHWTVRQLEQMYGRLRFARGDISVAERLLVGGNVQLILDGLDEMPGPVRGQALKAINRALRPEEMFVITCRDTEYADAVNSGDALTAASVIRSKPLKISQSISYLRHATPLSGLAQWEPIFAQVAAGTAGALAEILSIALNVWLVRAVYSESHRDPSHLVDPVTFSTGSDLEKHLLDNFVDSVFEDAPPSVSITVGQRPPPVGSTANAKSWLAFLARHMATIGSRDFAWWRLRDAITPAGSTVGYGIFGLATFGLWALAEQRHAFIIGTVGALATALAGGFRPRPERRYSDIRGREVMWSAMRLAGRVAMVGIASYLAGGALMGLLGLLLGGLTVAMAQWSWEPVTDERDADPLSALKVHRGLFVRNILSGLFAGAVVGGLISLLARDLGGNSGFTFLGGIARGLVPGFVLGLVAPNAWLGYQVARLVLASRRDIPWRLMGFLSRAHRVGALRQVGPVFQFRHLRLQEALTNNSID